MQKFSQFFRFNIYYLILIDLISNFLITKASLILFENRSKIAQNNNLRLKRDKITTELEMNDFYDQQKLIDDKNSGDLFNKLLNNPHSVKILSQNIFNDQNYADEEGEFIKKEGIK